MNKFTFLLISIMLMSCADNIGTLDFEAIEENNFSNFVQNIGTFNIKQIYSPSINPNTILTSLKVESTPQVVLEYEIFAFKHNVHSYKNIFFISRDSILTNQKEFKNLNTQGGYILNNEKLQISIIKRNINDTINKNPGHYEGVSKLITISTEQENTFELITLFGNIDYNNQVILYPTTEIEGFDRLIGIYNNTNEFFGKVYFNNIETGTISNNSSNFNINNNILSDSLYFNINNVEKKIALIINKTN